jgi:hypothetical protein
MLLACVWVCCACFLHVNSCANFSHLFLGNLLWTRFCAWFARSPCFSFFFFVCRLLALVLRNLDRFRFVLPKGFSVQIIISLFFRIWFTLDLILSTFCSPFVCRYFSRFVSLCSTLTFSVDSQLNTHFALDSFTSTTINVLHNHSLLLTLLALSLGQNASDLPNMYIRSGDYELSNCPS